MHSNRTGLLFKQEPKDPIFQVWGHLFISLKGQKIRDRFHVLFCPLAPRGEVSWILLGQKSNFSLEGADVSLPRGEATEH